MCYSNVVKQRQKCLSCMFEAEINHSNLVLTKILFHSVLHNWCNKDRCMHYSVWDGAYKTGSPLSGWQQLSSHRINVNVLSVIK